ncbi:DUF167 domain-containing protein [Candidatus Pacearchaeota archaeon]|nr:DUF167 domain-containing protein [Candidatus Pacearchaeota archaeon]
MYIKVKVKTGSKKEQIKKISEDTFEIEVKAPAERGLANKRILELVREYFKVYNVREVRLVSGHHSPHKIINLSLENSKK